MAHVSPPPTLVIRPQEDDVPRWRRWLTLALFWLASLIVAVAVTWVWRENVPANGAAQLRTALDQANALQQRLAVLERAQQVATAANADLQREIGQRQEEIAGLRADLAFYSSLTRADAGRDGLAVQALSLAGERDNPRLFHFTVTLTQNLKPGQVASGQVRLDVRGTRAGKLVTVAWPDLVADTNAKGMGFSFKYFQQIKGTLLLPDGFAPDGVRVEADAGTEFGKSSRDFEWGDVLATPGETHAGESK
ncbi:MAG: hypothetical protein QM741_08685 [Rudaea sp.]|uniref:DUF6776 family protein n=1 Tax=Rudaea sp. TaxID=2136325 RepID=UPI0039E4F08A